MLCGENSYFKSLDVTLTLYTVGHGSRQIGELMALLKEVGVDTLVDVRAQPHSRHNPQFNDDALRLACDKAGIVYHWAGRQLRKMGLRRKVWVKVDHFLLNAAEACKSEL